MFAGQDVALARLTMMSGGVDDEPGRRHLRRVPTAGLSGSELRAIRALLDEAFGPSDEEAFTDDDWDHGLGGVHFVLDVDGGIVAHASVVERELHVGDVPLRTGYVEAVATSPAHQNAGYGSLVMADATTYIQTMFELGALGTGRHAFYERLGWRTWRGRAYVRTAAGLRRTPDEEGYILVLETPASPRLDPTLAISCDWRPGDVW